MPNEIGTKPEASLTGIKVKTRKVRDSQVDRVINDQAVSELAVTPPPTPEQAAEQLATRASRPSLADEDMAKLLAEHREPTASRNRPHMRPSVHELLADLADNAESVRLLSEETLTSSLPKPPEGGLIGKVIDGRYRIIQKLGEGGSGIVYKAEHTVFQNFIAIKVLHPRHASDERALRRFLHEARTVVRLRHPNAIAVHEFGVVGNLPYLVMEYVEGLSLTDLIIKDGPFSLSRTFEITKQICAALASAHGMGIVHRDLKPDNIMIRPEKDGAELVQVLDFGIAKILTPTTPEAANITREGVPCGTPHYMSPEQVLAKELDHRSDLYSLGIIIYEMLTGTAPFSECSPIEVMFKQIHTVPIPPSEFCPELKIPENIERIVAKLLEKEPEKRYQTADELVADFELGLREQRSPSGPMPSLKRKLGRMRRNREAYLQQRPLVRELREIGMLALVIIGVVVFIKFREECRVRYGAQFLRFEHYVGTEFPRIKSWIDVDERYDPKLLVNYTRLNDVWGVELLLRAGISPNLRDTADPELPYLLHIAVNKSNAETLERLLRFDADVSVRNDNGLTALMVAAKNNEVQMIYLLARAKADLEAKDQLGRTALMFALETKSIGAIHALLELGVSVHATDAQDVTTLMYAVRSGDASIVDLMLSKGAALNAKNNAKETALTQAIRRSETGVAVLLIKRGADVNVKARDGLTPLMLAVDANSAEMVTELLAAGADPTALDPSGQPIIARVTSRCTPSIREALIAAGREARMRLGID